MRRSKARSKDDADVTRLFERLADPLRDRPADVRRLDRLGRSLSAGASKPPTGPARDDVLSSRGT